MNDSLVLLFKKKKPKFTRFNYTVCWFIFQDHEGKSGVDEIAVSKVKCSSSSSKEKGEDNTLVKTDHQTEEKSQTLKDRKTLRDISKERKGIEGSISVSWRVPHKKRGEKQPGFNLDYSPPKTHPPSHN